MFIGKREKYKISENLYILFVIKLHASTAMCDSRMNFSNFHRFDLGSFLTAQNISCVRNFSVAGILSKLVQLFGSGVIALLQRLYNTWKSKRDWATIAQAPSNGDSIVAFELKYVVKKKANRKYT